MFIVNTCRGIWNRFVPASGTSDRTIFNSYISLGLLPGTDLDRDAATIASLNGRVIDNNLFVQWITGKSTGTVYISPAERQRSNLISQVITATALYFTWNLSLYTSLSKLLSHSEKISKIAEPILNRVASSQITRLLLSTRVVILTPVIVKLIHIALIYMNPPGKRGVLERVIEKTSRTVEFLLHLRFTLLCLGLSTKVHTSIAVTICLTLWNHFTKPQIDAFFKRVKCEAEGAIILPMTDWYIFSSLNKLVGTSYWPTAGFQTGLRAMLQSWQASSEPYDIQVLERLLHRAIIPPQLNNVQELKTHIETLKRDIDQALKDGKISASHATKLNQNATQLSFTVLCTALHDYSYIQNITDADWPIIAQVCHLQENDAFIRFLQDLNKPIDLTSFIRGFDTIGMIQPLLVNTCRMALLSKMENFYQQNQDVSPTEADEITLFEIFGPSGRIHELNTDAASQFRAYLLSAKFCIERFERSLRLYLANPPSDLAGREKIEFCLLHLHNQSILNSESILSFSGLAAALQENNVTQNAEIERYVQNYIRTSSLFDFVRHYINIPANFAFATSTLVLAIRNKKTFINPDSPAPFLPRGYHTVMTQEKQDMSAFLQKLMKKNTYNPNDFLPTHVTQKRYTNVDLRLESWYNLTRCAGFPLRKTCT